MGVEVGGRRFEGGLLGFRGGLGLFQCGLVLRDLRAFLCGVFALSAIGFASCWFVGKCGLFLPFFFAGERSPLLFSSSPSSSDERRSLDKSSKSISLSNPPC